MTDYAHPRRDVERNHETILSAAISVLANAPKATMADIARASHTGRSTLYRHFPDRESLIDAIYERVLSEAEAICRQHLPTPASTDTVEVIADLCNALAALGDRYRFLKRRTAENGFRDPRTVQRLQSIFDQCLTVGQADRQIRSDLDRDWLVAMLWSIISLGADHRFRSSTRRADTTRATVRSLLSPEGRL